MRTYWLSFADEEHFLGATIVDVTEAERDAAAVDLAARFPRHDPIRGPWIAAAVRKTHELGINPGGQVISGRLASTDPRPRNTLFSRQEAERWAVADQS
jgi:hypothetical protein